MSERMYCIGGEWLTYEQAHKLGYTLLPPQILTLYTESEEPVSIIKDVVTKQVYDSANQLWLDDITSLNLYRHISTDKLYRGESYTSCKLYSSSLIDDTSIYAYYDSSMTLLESLYSESGITSYPCENIITISDSVKVWYDSNTHQWFDDRDGIHQWVNSFNDQAVIAYSASSHTKQKVYENSVDNTFYIGEQFISRSEFYSDNTNGIVRSTVQLFQEDDPETTLIESYFDSYSDKYCIPDVTDQWLTLDELQLLGYILVDDYANFYLNIIPLHLLHTILRPKTATITFTNSSHPEFDDLVLPDAISELIGEFVTLPEVTGTYTSSDFSKWEPSAWSIGSFNSSYKLTANVDADLLFERLSATLSFENTSSMSVDLPDSITGETGSTITLPTVIGTYYDSRNFKWSPSAWDIGSFESSYLLKEDTTAKLVLSPVNSTITFVNTNNSTLSVPLPVPITRQSGDQVLLPRLYGIYRDENHIGWIPKKWSLGEFDSLITITDDISANLILDAIPESVDTAICGSMPNDSGASTEASASLIIIADGLMHGDDISRGLPERYLFDECESFGGAIKIWNSTYSVPSAIKFPEKTETEDTSQHKAGTLRKWGTKANSFVDFLPIEFTILSRDANIVYPERCFTSDCTVTGDQLSIWHSSYTSATVTRPTKPANESTDQMMSGSIRKWGNYANTFITMSSGLFGKTSIDSGINLPIRKFYNSVECYGDVLKLYDKVYVPIVIELPEKTSEESNQQMICGTLRKWGTKANRGITIENTFGSF